MKTILCPIDFSETSIKALLYAYDIALQSGAELHLLHTYHIPRVVSLMEHNMQPELEMQILYEREANEKIENLVNWLNKIYAPASVNATFRIVSNFALDEIVKTSYEKEADLIVMETTCTNSLKDIFFGTHTVRVIEETHRPVLVVPATAHYTKISHVLYAIQGNKPSAEEAAYLSNFAGFLNATVTVLPAPAGGTTVANKARTMVESQPASMNSSKSHSPVTSTTQSIQENINRFVEEKPSALIAISAQRRYLLEEINSGTISYPLHTPVLVLQ